MKKNIFLLLFLSNIINIYSLKITLTKDEINEIGKKIFKNECGCDPYKLTWWNDREDFASLGIGHFIWYPKNNPRKFEETFPKLIKFFEANNVQVPDFVKKCCPWKDKGIFFYDFYGKDMKSLRKLLSETFALQTKFIIQRVHKNWEQMTAKAFSRNKEYVIKQFNRVAKSLNGMYAIIDYLNFKGEGLSTEEKYENQGWGLLQVLENMNGDEVGKKALEDFVKSANELLELRVKNSPKLRNEEKWLPGWKNRLKTYLK